MTMLWVVHGGDPEVLGFVPTFFDDDDPRPAREQIAERYAHGGGWHPMDEFALVHEPDKKMQLLFPGDPPFEPLAFATLHGEEMLVLFEHEILMILQKDGSFEAARID